VIILQTGAAYSTETSDLAIKILKVQYRSDNYTKVKAMLYNRINGIVYEHRSNYKLIHHRIRHWKILNPLTGQFQ